MDSTTISKKEKIHKVKTKVSAFFSNLKCRILKSLKNPDSLFYYVLILAIIGFAFYAFALITNCWTTPYGGDYTQEQIPFFYNGYDDWWTFFKTGQFPMYDENTFFGADNIGSNSFYYLFNPFFMITLLFPRAAIPHVMACESILKVIVAGLLMRWLLKYIGVKEASARVFGSMYGVCGWVAFYFWFNTFADVACLLPLVLVGIEKVLKERKPFTLIIGVFLEAVNNYFFLFTICLFGVGYALFRYFQTFKTRSGKDNLKSLFMGIGCFALGIGMSCFVIVPGFLTAMESSRADSANFMSTISRYSKALISFKDLKCGLSEPSLNYLFRWNGIHSYFDDFKAFGEKVLFDWDIGSSSDASYRQYYPLLSFLFPSVSCRYVAMVDINYEWNMGSSLFVFIPTTFMLVVSFFNSIRKRKISHLIAILMMVILLFTPFFYSLFFYLNAQYGRWQFIAVVLILIYAAINFDERKEMPFGIFPISALIVLAMMCVSYYIVRTKIYFPDSGHKYNNMLDWIFIITLCVASVEAAILFLFWKKNWLCKVVITMVLIEACGVGTATAIGHGLTNYYNNCNGGLLNVNDETEIINKIKENDSSYFRIYSTRGYQGNENIAYREGYNSTSTFHSLYNYNVDDFIRMSHVLKSSSTWIGGIVEKRLYLDTFLGVKYYICKENETAITYSHTKTNADGTKTVEKEVKDIEPNMPLGFERIYEGEIPDGYRVYENKNHIDFGFSYDSLYYKYAKNEDEFSSSIYNDFYKTSNDLSPIIAEETYLKGAILNNSDIEEISKNYTFDTQHAPSMEAKKLTVSYQTYTYKSGAGFDPFKISMINDSTKVEKGAKTIGSDYSKQVLVITPSSGKDYINESENGDYLILNYPLRRDSGANYNAMVYLYDENDNLISADAHTQPGYTNNYKRLRGFYGKNIAKIVVAPKSNKISFSTPDLYSYTNEQYMERINEFKSYPLENVKNGVNKYTFETNFDQDRFIVTQLAYEKGFKVKVNINGETKELKTYNAQGGFLGFVAEKGAAKYEVSYFTKGGEIALPISIVCFLIFDTLIVLCIIRRKEKKLSE